MKTKLFGLMLTAVLGVASAQTLQTKQNAAKPPVVQPIAATNNSALLIQSWPAALYALYGISYSDRAVLTPNEAFALTPWLRGSALDLQDPLELEETVWAESLR